MDDLLELMICRIPGLRGEEKLRLENEFDTVDDFLVLSKQDIEYFLQRVLNGPSWNMAEIRVTAENADWAARKLGVKRVSFRDKEYPPLLREIYDPPLLLFYRGELPDPEKPLAAVVGTRTPTALAGRRAFTLGRELGEAGIPVVSGLALGIDAFAHRGNIEGKARTAAVLGSSPDMVYPASNRPLARRILETGGIILSEYPPGTGPRKWNFPARNRIISALARGVVIVEAPEKSGALITAQFALEQGRDLWVDAEGAGSPRGAGTARLAEDGAKRIFSARDITEEWNMRGTFVHPDENKTTDRIARNGGAGAGLASSLAEYLDIEV